MHRVQMSLVAVVEGLLLMPRAEPLGIAAKRELAKVKRDVSAEAEARSTSMSGNHSTSVDMLLWSGEEGQLVQTMITEQRR